MSKPSTMPNFLPVSSSSAFAHETPPLLESDQIFFQRPRVITLCGSTRFMDQFERLNELLTLEGNVVFSVAAKAHEGVSHVSQEQKVLLDRVHLEKIRLSDEIFVVNVGGYIGPSTKREIEFAQRLGKIVRYLEPVPRSGTADVAHSPL